MTWSMISENLVHFAAGGSLEEIVVSGGEPTEHCDILRVLQEARNVADALYLHTNAGIPFYQNLDEVLRYITKCMVSYHHVGGTSTVTDSCIRRIVSSGVTFRTNTLLIGANSSELEGIIDHVHTLGARHMLFSYPFPLGGTADPRCTNIETDPKKLAQIVERVVRATSERDISVYFQGIPRCFLGNLADLQDKWIDRVLVDVNHQFDSAIMLFDGLLGRGYLLGCDTCEERNGCAGTWPMSWHRTVFFERSTCPPVNQ